MWYSKKKEEEGRMFVFYVIPRHPRSLTKSFSHKIQFCESPNVHNFEFDPQIFGVCFNSDVRGVRLSD